MEQSIYNKARKDKFLLFLTIPEILKNVEKRESTDSGSIDFDRLQYSIYGHITPEIIVPAVGVGFSGQEVKVSSHSRQPYGNSHVTFDVDNEYKNWWVLYRWLNALNDEKFSYYNEDQTIPQGEAEKALQKYSSKFTVYALDEYGGGEATYNRVMKFDYTGCFPVSLGKIEYSDRDPDILTCDLEFAFSFFEAKPV
jgi:hypothetical protein